MKNNSMILEEHIYSVLNCLYSSSQFYVLSVLTIIGGSK